MQHSIRYNWKLKSDLLRYAVYLHWIYGYCKAYKSKDERDCTHKAKVNPVVINPGVSEVNCSCCYPCKDKQKDVIKRSVHIFSYFASLEMVNYH